MSDDSNGRSLARFNAWWLAAAILVVAVIAALVLVLIFGQKSEPTPADTAAPSASSAPSNGRGSVTPNEETCGLPTSEEIPTVGPDAEWVNRSFLLVPTSSTFGPIDRDESVWGCFAWSPTGALFAAANFMGGIQSSNDADSLKAFVQASAVDNKGRELFIEDMSDRAAIPKEPGRTAQISGFQFTRVDAAEVVVRIGLNQGAGAETVKAYMPFSMVWDSSASTWMVDFDRVRFDTVADELVGYTPWDAGQ